MSGTESLFWVFEACARNVLQTRRKYLHIFGDKYAQLSMVRLARYTCECWLTMDECLVGLRQTAHYLQAISPLHRSLFLSAKSSGEPPNLPRDATTCTDSPFCIMS